MELKLRLPDCHGLWCSFLLPVALLTNCLADYRSGVHLVVCILSLGLLIVFFEKRSQLIISQVPQPAFLKGSYLLMSLFCSILLAKLSTHNFYSVFITSYATAWMFDYLYHLLLVKCPQSFTLGEAAVVVQGTVLFIISCLLTWLKELYQRDDAVPETSSETKFLQILLVGCFLVILAEYSIKFLQTTLAFYGTCAAFGMAMYVAWVITLRQDPVLWLISVCFRNKKRVILMIFWVVSTAASILFVIHENRKRVTQASTVTRKYFHVIVILVYLPGILVDPQLLYVASAVTLGVFLMLEMLRILKIPPLGPLIEDAFQIFLDEKDAGILILTHIYLLIGCSCPLWLHSGNLSNTNSRIVLLSGVISVGFGDTIASVIGSRFGKHKWIGSEKSIEGTLSAILVQAAVALPILYFDHMMTLKNVFLVSMAVTMTSLLEAKTAQVDNLILPLFMFPFLRFVQ